MPPVMYNLLLKRSLLIDVIKDSLQINYGAVI